MNGKGRVGGEGRTKRAIVARGALALSLAGALLATSGDPAAALAGNGVSTPTSPAPPLKLDLRVAEVGGAFPRKKLKFFATTNNNSYLVASGRKIKKIRPKQLYAGAESIIKVGLKHGKRLYEKPGPPVLLVTVKFAATDVFGQTATDAIRLKIMVGSDGRVLIVIECPCRQFPHT